MYNQLLGWWVANQNHNTKQKHPSLNAQRHHNWIRQRIVSATGHTRGRCEQWGVRLDSEVSTDNLLKGKREKIKSLKASFSQDPNREYNATV